MSTSDQNRTHRAGSSDRRPSSNRSLTLDSMHDLLLAEGWSYDYHQLPDKSPLERGELVHIYKKEALQLECEGRKCRFYHQDSGGYSLRWIGLMPTTERDLLHMVQDRR